MRTIQNPIGCIAFTNDGHRTVIIGVQEETTNIKGYLVGRCVHGDTFEFPLDHPIFEQVKYIIPYLNKKTKDQIATVMLQHGTSEQQKEASEYLKESYI